ncbi:MAG TPA: acyl carrier protein [Candidatus Limadaptatus stercoravium]|nr:acyl carrier protein [Candidatus Limadaptatus stercoravium]
MNNDIFEKLKAIAVNQIGIDEEKVTPESDIIKDLGLDSLDIVDMLMSVEETFGVTIDDGDVAEMKTVADVVKFIEDNVA